jgi:hypothetical protein
VLTPLEHHVPLAEGLSSLNETFLWMRANATQVRDVASKGLEFCLDCLSCPSNQEHICLAPHDAVTLIQRNFDSFLKEHGVSNPSPIKSKCSQLLEHCVMILKGSNLRLVACICASRVLRFHVFRHAWCSAFKLLISLECRERSNDHQIQSRVCVNNKPCTMNVSNDAWRSLELCLVVTSHQTSGIFRNPHPNVWAFHDENHVLFKTEGGQHCSCENWWQAAIVKFSTMPRVTTGSCLWILSSISDNVASQNQNKNRHKMGRTSQAAKRLNWEP